MAFLGLVPSERTTGDTVRRGSVTKTGNHRARRVLIEGAWTNSPLATESMDDRYWRSPRLRNAVAACATCVDLRMAIKGCRTAMETIRTGNWNQAEQETLMSESYESFTLPTKPEGMVATLCERFNSGK